MVKVEAMHKTTDIYGPIPYTRFGLQTPVPYDSQEAVYMRFFTELNHAIGVLTTFDKLNPGAKPLEATSRSGSVLPIRLSYAWLCDAARCILAHKSWAKRL